jgi:hypothetical protein
MLLDRVTRIDIDHILTLLKMSPVSPVRDG